MKKPHEEASGTEARGPVGTRKEAGDAAGSREHPPHVTESDKDAPLQGEHEGEDIPTLPATAHGKDRIPSEDEPRTVDDESAYEGRRTQDKDQPPSGQAG
jgi:hypothetical protein